MATIPQSTKDSLEVRLLGLIRKDWPQVRTITVKFRGSFAYITAITKDEQTLPLCRLRYIGYSSEWGFAPYRASHNDYADAYFPDGTPTGTPEDAFNTASSLYLNAEPANQPPTN
ncbi:hypothetical protein [Cryobacterium sp. SO1]|uniref:hypothetical protein n=1 Tax=Cryobacterium sp. SO1 TaxID=1897061 RepID=UPI001022A671|nr:hypothetical protein [Cryobacterium sp. SO1]